jgi:hypothetical protein
VDFAASVDDGMLGSLNVPKGGRRVISVPERAQVMQLLEGCDSQVGAFRQVQATMCCIDAFIANCRHCHAEAGFPAEYLASP